MSHGSVKENEDKAQQRFMLCAQLDWLKEPLVTMVLITSWLLSSL